MQDYEKEKDKDEESVLALLVNNDPFLPIIMQLIPKGPNADTEKLGGLGSIIVVRAKGLKDKRLLHILHRGARANNESAILGGGRALTNALDCIGETRWLSRSSSWNGRDGGRTLLTQHL